MNRTETANTPLTTRFPLLFRHRPQVTRMRDLSPETKQRVMDEYYKSYDVMTGVRIAATLGGLITLFTLFLIYKSKCKTIRGVAKTKQDPDIDTTSSSESTSTSSNQRVIVVPADPKQDLSPLEEIVIQVPTRNEIDIAERDADKGESRGPCRGGIVGGSGAGEVGEASGPQTRAVCKDRPPLKSEAEGSRSLPCSPYRDTQSKQPPSKGRKPSKTSFPSESVTSSFSSKGSGAPATEASPPPKSPTPPPPPPQPISRAKDRRRSSCHKHPRTSILAGPALMAAAAIAIPGSRGGQPSQRRREVRGSMRLMSLSSQLSARRKSTKGPRFLPPWD